MEEDGHYEEHIGTNTAVKGTGETSTWEELSSRWKREGERVEEKYKIHLTTSPFL